MKIGDDVLRKTAHKVTKFDAKLHTLLDDMHETMIAADGAGLAAPQVGILRRIAVVDVGEGKIEIVNPEIVFSEGEVLDIEGCLSVEGRRGKVRRPQKVTVRAQDRHGEWFERTGEGYLARAFSHEIDHLNGVLFVDMIEEEVAHEDSVSRHA